MISAGEGRFPVRFSLNEFKMAFPWIAPNVTDTKGPDEKKSGNHPRPVSRVAEESLFQLFAWTMPAVSGRLSTVGR